MPVTRRNRKLLSQAQKTAITTSENFMKIYFIFATTAMAVLIAEQEGWIDELPAQARDVLTKMTDYTWNFVDNSDIIGVGIMLYNYMTILAKSPDRSKAFSKLPEKLQTGLRLASNVIMATLTTKHLLNPENVGEAVRANLSFALAMFVPALPYVIDLGKRLVPASCQKKQEAQLGTVLLPPKKSKGYTLGESVLNATLWTSSGMGAVMVAASVKNDSLFQEKLGWLGYALASACRGYQLGISIFYFFYPAKTPVRRSTPGIAADAADFDRGAVSLNETRYTVLEEDPIVKAESAPRGGRKFFCSRLFDCRKSSAIDEPAPQKEIAHQVSPA